MRFVIRVDGVVCVVLCVLCCCVWIPWLTEIVLWCLLLFVLLYVVLFSFRRVNDRVCVLFV